MDYGTNLSGVFGSKKERNNWIIIFTIHYSFNPFVIAKRIVLHFCLRLSDFQITYLLEAIHAII